MVRYPLLAHSRCENHVSASALREGGGQAGKQLQESGNVGSNLKAEGQWLKAGEDAAMATDRPNPHRSPKAKT